MKKLLIPLLALFTFISVNDSLAQSKSAERKQAREVRQEAFMNKLANSIKEGQFTFTAQTFQANIGNPININYPNNFLSLYGNVLDVQLPYYSFSAVQQAPALIDFIDAPVLYQVSYDGTNYYVLINVRTTANAGQTFITQMGQYKFHLTINARSGFTILTVTPQLSTSSTYTGVVQSN